MNVVRPQLIRFTSTETQAQDTKVDTNPKAGELTAETDLLLDDDEPFFTQGSFAAKPSKKSKNRLDKPAIGYGG